METIAVEQPRTMKWYEVWGAVLRSSSPETFRRILSDPSASLKRGLIWIALIAEVGALITWVPMAGQPGSILWLVGYVLFLPIVAVAGVMIITGLCHWIAGRFGGTGQFDSLGYAFAAINAPISLLSYALSIVTTLMLVSLGGENQGAGLCTRFISMALGLYTFVLNIQAIRSVENISGGKAFLTLVLPLVVLLGLWITVLFFTLALFGS